MAFASPAARIGRLALALGLGLPFAVHAQSGSVSGSVALSSQLVDRGQAITPQTPVLQGAAAWAVASGWNLGASASIETRSPDHVAEALVQAMRYWRLSADWQMQANALYDNYPGHDRRKAFDRAEAGLGWLYRDVLSLGLSAIHPVSGSDHRLRGAVDLGVHWPLPWRLALSAGVGIAQPTPLAYGYYADDHAADHGDAESYGYGSTRPYRYGHVGLLWSHGPWRIEVDRVATDGLPRVPDDLRTAAWVATASWSF